MAPMMVSAKRMFSFGIEQNVIADKYANVAIMLTAAKKYLNRLSSDRLSTPYLFIFDLVRHNCEHLRFVA